MIFFDRSKDKYNVKKKNEKFSFKKDTYTSNNKSIFSKIKDYFSSCKCNLSCCSNCSCPTCSKICSFAKSRPYCFAAIISGIVLFIIVLIIVIVVLVQKNKNKNKEINWEEIYNDIGDNDKGTLSEFCAYLKEEASDLNEDGKVNLAYKWITANIYYDENTNSAERDPDKFFKSRKTVCSGYAHLFYRLLTAMEYNPDNIRNITGYAKGASYKVLSTPKVDHEWSSVKINGKWCLFDATWDKQKSDYAYFCPSSSCFARDHLPEKSEYQYLDNPINLNTFKNYAWTSGYFCQFNAEINADTAYYNSCGSGSGSFTIKYNVDYNTQLYINKTNGVDFDIKAIDKGFKVDYSYSNIGTNQQIELQMFMLDENLEKPYIGSVYLICSS